MNAFWTELKRYHCFRRCFKSCLDTKPETNYCTVEQTNESSSTGGLMEPRTSPEIRKNVPKGRFQYTVDPDVLKNAFRQIIEPTKSWVLFKNGTIVIGADNVDDIEAEAKEFLRENGKIVAGTPLGDFDPKFLPHMKGWLIKFHTDRILTFVPGEEGDMDELSMAYGLLGRGLRQIDSKELVVIDIVKNPFV